VSGEAGQGHSALSVFAGELRLARTATGLSQERLAEKIAYSSSLVAMVESCRRIPSLDFAQRCDEVLETGGVLVRLHPLVAGEAYPSWFRPFVELERTAVSLRSWELILVPGLLQTEDYARAVLHAARPTDADEQINESVTARMERQTILTRDDPPMLWVVLDEAVLRRPVGGRRVMGEQLGYLLNAARMPKIIVQIVPLEVGANAGMTGAFVIASFDSAPDTVHLDTAGAGLIADRADVVASCAFAFDALRADALSPAASLESIRKAADSWT
jgi:transcriptional regulator with XRE-family HTH domain